MMSEKDLKRPRVSPLRYPGGKASLYPRLKRLLRSMDMSNCEYVEPYAGGVGAGLALLVTNEVDRIVINDFDPAIYAFWFVVKTMPKYLIQRIKDVPLNIDEWQRQRQIYLQKDSTDLPNLAFATFYLNRTNNSGVLKGGPIGGLLQKGNYKIDARFNREELAERIRLIGLYSNKITVTSLDGKDVIAEYANHSDAFIYADPPYFEKAGSLYMNAFTSQDHESLSKVMNSNSDATWLLTYDNVPQVYELYKDRRIREYNLHYSAHRVVDATEVSVLSDSLPDIGDNWVSFD